MTTRDTRLAILIGIGGLALVGCGTTPTAPPPAETTATTTAPEADAVGGDDAPTLAPIEETTEDQREAAVIGSSCMPAWYESADPAVAPNARLVLVRDGDGVVLCAIDDAELRGVHGCWDVDPSNGRLTGRATLPLRGYSFRVELDAKGCVDGYCLPGGPKDQFRTRLATSTDGQRALLLSATNDGLDFHVFDAATKQLVRTIPNSLDGQTVAVWNEPYDLYYVGHRFWVLGADAGPFMALTWFSDDGAQRGLIDMGKLPGRDEPSPLSLWQGSVSVLDADHLGLSTVALRETRVVNAADGRATIIKRAVKSVPCPEEWTLEVTGSDVSPKCTAWLESNVLPWRDGHFVALPDGGYLAVTTRGALYRLDAKLAVKDRFAASLCPH